MAIYVPGQRDRHNRPWRRGRRSVVVALSLTAMVDMFTVLVIFLLKQYATTGQVIYLPKDVRLPEASEIKELKMAHVVTISKEKILFDTEIIGNFKDLEKQESWVYEPLKKRIETAFEKEDKLKVQGLTNRLKKAVNRAKSPSGPDEDENRKARKVTVQADRMMDMLSVKKVMMTVSEGGAKQINFAVLKKGGAAP